MNEGAAKLVDHVLPEGVPIRQWVLTLPHSLRYPFAFDGQHLGQDGEVPAFQAASRPTQEDIEGVVQRAKRRILRYLEKCGVITFAAAPGDGEVEVVIDESLGEADPVLARLFSAATQGVAPAGPAQSRAPGHPLVRFRPGRPVLPPGPEDQLMTGRVPRPAAGSAGMLPWVPGAFLDEDFGHGGRSPYASIAARNVA